MSATYEEVRIQRPHDPLIHIKLLGITFTAILDSGSSLSIIGNDALNLLKSRGMVTTPTNQCLAFAGGTTITANEQAELIVNFEIWNTKANFLLLPSRPGNMVILGIDFLQAADMILYIRLGGWAISVGGEQIFYPFVKCCSLEKTCEDGMKSQLQQYITNPHFYPHTCLLHRDRDGSGFLYRDTTRTASRHRQNILHHRLIIFLGICPPRIGILQPQPIYPIVGVSNPESIVSSNITTNW